MYRIIFYEDDKDQSDLLEWMRNLNNRAEYGDKNSRVLLAKITYLMRRAELDGTRAGEKYCKHIRDRIWELRPDDHRILFFVGKATN